MLLTQYKESLIFSCRRSMSIICLVILVGGHRRICRYLVIIYTYVCVSVQILGSDKGSLIFQIILRQQRILNTKVFFLYLSWKSFFNHILCLQLWSREGRWIFRVMGLNKKLAVFNLERESFVELLKVPGTHLLNLLFVEFLHECRSEYFPPLSW